MLSCFNRLRGILRSAFINESRPLSLFAKPFDLSKRSFMGKSPERVPVLTLYQYEICPYCAKVKAFLDFFRVPYTTCEVNPLTKSQLGAVDFRQRKVPFAVFRDGNQGESGLIIESLKFRGYIDFDNSADLSEYRKWCNYVDKDLSVLLFPNITRNLTESWEAFSYIQLVPTFTMMEKVLNRVLGSIAMVLASGKIKRKYNIQDEREQLLKVVSIWTTALEGEKFKGGAKPNEIDLLVFGTLRAVEDLKAHRWLLSEGGSELKDWYMSMSELVGPRHVGRIKRVCG